MDYTAVMSVSDISQEKLLSSGNGSSSSSSIAAVGASNTVSAGFLLLLIVAEVEVISIIIAADGGIRSPFRIIEEIIAELILLDAEFSLTRSFLFGVGIISTIIIADCCDGGGGGGGGNGEGDEKDGSKGLESHLLSSSCSIPSH